MNVIHAAALIDSIWCDISRDCNTYSFDIYDVTCKTCLQAIIDERCGDKYRILVSFAKVRLITLGLYKSNIYDDLAKTLAE